MTVCFFVNVGVSPPPSLDVAKGFVPVVRAPLISTSKPIRRRHSASAGGRMGSATHLMVFWLAICRSTSTPYRVRWV
jgi:hypothetical protein